MRGAGKAAPRARDVMGRLVEPEVIEPSCPEKPLSDETRVTVPQTDTGRWVENTKGNGRTFVKELGKIPP
jgi:hypothetical protein